MNKVKVKAQLKEWYDDYSEILGDSTFISSHLDEIFGSDPKNYFEVNSLVEILKYLIDLLGEKNDFLRAVISFPLPGSKYLEYTEPTLDNLEILGQPPSLSIVKRTAKFYCQIEEYSISIGSRSFNYKNGTVFCTYRCYMRGEYDPDDDYSRTIYFEFFPNEFVNNKRLVNEN